MQKQKEGIQEIKLGKIEFSCFLRDSKVKNLIERKNLTVSRTMCIAQSHSLSQLRGI
jgi:hypothetical protein